MLGISGDFKIVSRVHRTEVTTFNDYVKAIHMIPIQPAFQHSCSGLKDSMNGSEESINMDLRGAMGKSFFVTQMNERTHRWENMSYEIYIQRAFLL